MSELFDEEIITGRGNAAYARINTDRGERSMGRVTRIVDVIAENRHRFRADHDHEWHDDPYDGEWYVRRCTICDLELKSLEPWTNWGM